MQRPKTFAECISRRCRCEHEHWARIVKCLSDWGQRIGDAWAADENADTRAAGDYRPAISHEPCALFVAG